VNCGQLVNGKATIYGIAPVHNAIAHSHTSHTNNMLNQVLENEADVNVTDTNGYLLCYDEDGHPYIMQLNMEN